MEQSWRIPPRGNACRRSSRLFCAFLLGGRRRPNRNVDTAPLILLLMLLLLLLLMAKDPSAVVRAECPPEKDCGPYGVCLLDSRSCGDNCQERCKCVPNYYGSDCSLRAETCPDAIVGTQDEARECLNGGTCYLVSELAGNNQEDGGGGMGTDTVSPVNSYYRCDCRRAYGDAGRVVHAGHQCEYPAEVSCEQGVEQSLYAFCVNGGTCPTTVPSGSPFGGCACPTEYEGRHCQYLYGTAPSEELVYNPPTSASGNHFPPVAIFFLVVLAVAFVGGVAVLAWRRDKSHRMQKDGAQNTQDWNESGVVVSSGSSPATSPHPHPHPKPSASSPLGDDLYLHDDEDGDEVSSSRCRINGGGADTDSGLRASLEDREIL
jgi:hypothetical protein